MSNSQRLSSAQLLNVLSLSHNATAIYTGNNLIIEMANDAMLAFWGRDRSVIGKTLEEAVPELEGQPFVKMLQDVLKSGITNAGLAIPAETMLNGILQTAYYDYEYRAVKNDAGETYCIFHTAANVTNRVLGEQAIDLARTHEIALFKEQSLNEELAITNEQLVQVQKRLEELNFELETRVMERTKELTESEARLRYMLLDAPISICLLTGPQLFIEAANKKMLQTWGKTDKVIGKPLQEAVPELKGQSFFDLLNNVYATGKPYHGDEIKALIEQDGVVEEVYTNFVYHPLKDEDGKTNSIVVLANVVTEQVQARKRLEQMLSEKNVLEHNLRENQMRLQSILDTMAEGVVIVNVAGNITYSNPMAQRILGLAAEQLNEAGIDNMPWDNLHVDGTKMERANHPVSVMLATGMAVYDQEIAIQPGGGKERFYISVNAAPLTNREGKITGGIATFMDVTNRRKLMQQKDEFISVASHELKTPITTLKASLQLLDRMKEKATPDMISRLITQSNKSLDKLSSLVADLLDVNRITQGQLQLRKTRFSVAGMINDCCHHIRSAGSHVISIEGDMDLQINADEQQIDQIIVNLVNNAVKYASESKEIFIKVKNLGNFVEISVKDSGPGVPPDKLPHLFDRYYRADYSGIQFSGLGLGLYICAEIIKKHKGKIGVDSELGKGSTFWFTLPLE